MEKEALEGIAVVGELALSGEVRRVRGVLPIALQTRAAGATLLVPPDNAEEAAVVEGLPVYPVRSLHEAVSFLTGQEDLDPAESDL